MQHFRPLNRIASRQARARPWLDREDATQELAVKLIGLIDRRGGVGYVEGRENFAACVEVIGRCLMIDLNRRGGRMDAAVPLTCSDLNPGELESTASLAAGDGVLTEVVRSEQVARVISAFRSLGAVDREALTRRHLDGESLRQLAVSMSLKNQHEAGQRVEQGERAFYDALRARGVNPFELCPPAGPLLGFKESAAYLGVCMGYLFHLTGEGRLRPVRHGKSKFIPRRQLDRVKLVLNPTRQAAVRAAQAAKQALIGHPKAELSDKH